MPEQPESSQPPGPTSAPVRRRVRRAPNIVPFLVTGGLIGAIAGAVIAAIGPDSPTSHYSHATSVGFFAFIFAALGVLLGAIAALIAEKVLTR